MCYGTLLQKLSEDVDAVERRLVEVNKPVRVSIDFRHFRNESEMNATFYQLPDFMLFCMLHLRRVVGSGLLFLE